MIRRIAGEDDQYERVPVHELQPGDVIFFQWDSGAVRIKEWTVKKPPKLTAIKAGPWQGAPKIPQVSVLLDASEAHKPVTIGFDPKGYIFRKIAK